MSKFFTLFIRPSFYFLPQGLQTKCLQEPVRDSDCTQQPGGTSEHTSHLKGSQVLFQHTYTHTEALTRVTLTKAKISPPAPQCLLLHRERSLTIHKLLDALSFLNLFCNVKYEEFLKFLFLKKIAIFRCCSINIF